jgi:ABC-type antimicrobial peptide transport system permease subunit
MAALSVPLLRGRLLDETDRENPPVVVVSEAWARRYYPDGEALGARLYAGGDRSVAMTVVGVVGNVKYMGLDVDDDQAVYEPYWQLNLRDGWLVVRGRTSVEEAMVDGVRSAIATLDPELPISNLQTMEQRTSDSLARPRQWTVLLGLFATLGLALACIGVYGVLSYYVGTQRKEIGVRIALGAEPRTVRRLILGRGMSVAALGIGIGMGVSLAMGRWLQPVIFGLSPRDPATLATVAIGLMALALLACAMPATRAMRIDPASTLKGE